MDKVLKTLTELHGPSGYEQEVSYYIQEEMRSVAEDVRVDGIGNVTARIKGEKPGPTVLVTAHMDEVGFIVKKIESNGLLRFEKLGGHDDRILLAQKVRVKGRYGLKRGVIGTIPAHYQKFDEAGRVRKHHELYIDVGARSKEEVEKLGIDVGSTITWASELEYLGDEETGRYVGKSLDDRAGCAVLMNLMQSLQDQQFAGEVIALFTVQEEVGLRGAQVGMAQVDCDVAIALDATVTSDTPEPLLDDTLRLGDGAGVKVLDMSLIAHPTVKEHFIQLAQEEEIPYQPELFTGIGTDGGAVALANKGVPTGVLSIPSRYAHAPVEVIDLEDLKAVEKLLLAFIKNNDEQTSFAF
ncbi:M42 family metallopeptidase [Pontibacillus sp. HN14]|uniref:M42 family metallopeptidase n=1 Tax=Pontibacillus chungwhensis TaxID=265426 RepID=A0ABY8V092_9BACI|nr:MULTISPECIES: M42 family metallopeptidase [Pontibacillus]MCD5324335.1 M42 family metallopeptidase [Pontibacillus sp. HN14]WIF99366.1 M42 family metallopeptidase [Pontibacillus chungwhensis]